MPGYISENRNRFNPNYDDSDRDRGRDADPERERLKREATNPLDNLNRDELVNENNFFKYDKLIQTYEPLAQPFSYFYLTIAGQIERGEFLELDGLQIRYTFVHGGDWQLAKGKNEGWS